MKAAVHQYEDKLLELAYGELSTGEASAVEAHVRGCAKCTDALSEIRAVRSTMGQLPMEPAPEAGLESLFAYADQAARRNAAGPAPVATWWRKLLAPLAAAGALSVVGVVAYQANREGGALPSATQVAEKASRQEALKEEKAESKVAEATPPAAPAAGAVAAAPEAEEFDSAGAPQAVEAQQVWKAKAGAAAPAKKMTTAAADDFGSDLKKAGKLAKDEETRKSRAKPANSRDGYDQDVSATTEKIAAAPIAEQKAGDKAKESGEAQAYGLAQGIPGGANNRAAPQAEQARVAAPPPSQAPAEPAANEGRVSLGVQLGNSNTGSSGSSSSYGGTRRNEPSQSQRQVMGPSGSLADRERNDVNTKSDAPAVANNAAKPQDMVAQLDAKMRQMNDAHRARDTETEIEIAMDLLRSAPPRSVQRLQALSSVCNGLTTLELYEKATPYCQAMLNEYPNSREATAYNAAQSRMRSTPKRAAKQELDYSEESAKSPPSPAERPEAKPTAK